MLSTAPPCRLYTMPPTSSIEPLFSNGNFVSDICDIIVSNCSLGLTDSYVLDDGFESFATYTTSSSVDFGAACPTPPWACSV